MPPAALLSLCLKISSHLSSSGMSLNLRGQIFRGQDTRSCKLWGRSKHTSYPGWCTEFTGDCNISFESSCSNADKVPIPAESPKVVPVQNPTPTVSMEITPVSHSHIQSSTEGGMRMSMPKKSLRFHRRNQKPTARRRHIVTKPKLLHKNSCGYWLCDC
jgi:hypothetical protein